MIDAFDHLEQLVDKTIVTVTGAPNKVLAVTRSEVLVGTGKSPAGKPVPLDWVQTALNRLATGEVEISVDSLGYRSAFVGAVLLTVPGVVELPTSPRRVRLDV
jgi:hypothetical protein